MREFKNLLLLFQDRLRCSLPTDGHGSRTTGGALCELEMGPPPTGDAGGGLDGGAEWDCGSWCSEQPAQPPTVAPEGGPVHRHPRHGPGLGASERPPAAHSPASTSTRTFLRVSASLPRRLWHW